MVELELLERGERAVALLGERQPRALGGVGLVEAVGVGRQRGLPQERTRHEDDTGDREHGAEDERERRHARAIAPASP